MVVNKLKVTLEQVETALAHLPVYIKSYGDEEAYDREGLNQEIVGFFTTDHV